VTARPYRVTLAAAEDVRTILRMTRTQFGTHQRRVYAELIERAATLVGTVPDLVGARDRGELGCGVRSFHFDNAAGRRSASAHTLYFQTLAGDGGQTTIILRVLHHRMEPALHLGPELTQRDNAG